MSFLGDLAGQPSSGHTDKAAGSLKGFAEQHDSGATQLSFSCMNLFKPRVRGSNPRAGTIVSYSKWPSPDAPGWADDSKSDRKWWARPNAGVSWVPGKAEDDHAPHPLRSRDFDSPGKRDATHPGRPVPSGAGAQPARRLSTAMAAGRAGRRSGRGG